MKQIPLIALILLINGLFFTQAQAAFVQYRDENGKVHYVNTEFSKVPEKYRGQVEEQLKQIEIEKMKALNAAQSVQALPQTDQTQTQNLGSSPIPLQVSEIPSEPITDANRVRRLAAVIEKLQISNFFPASANVNAGIVSYKNDSGQKFFVTPETIPSVPPKFLKQIDSQIVSFEKLAQSSQNKQHLMQGNAIEIYTGPNCSACGRLRTMLDAYKIKYFNYDVTTTSQGKAFYEKMGSPELPITQVGSKIFYGVDVKSIKQAVDALTTAQSGQQ